jgi:Tfp pilus assembly protein PilE
LIEIIFAILLIVIVSSIALPKFWDTILKSSIVKLKTEIIIIQNAINNYNAKFILLNQTSDLEKLEESHSTLFSNIRTTSVPKQWTKITNTTYNYKLNENNNLIFSFSSNNNTFTCDHTIPLCKEVLE